MPLFDAIEADVTAFFVSQGSVFDLLIKSVLERVATVENRVQVLRADVTTNLQTIRQQLLSASAGDSGRGDGSVSAVDADAIADAAKQAAASAVAAINANAATGRQAADERAMALARQLNTELELVFCPHPAGQSAVIDIREKQAGLLGIADVLRDNERILSQLGELPLSEGRADNDTSAVSKSDGDNGDRAGDSDPNGAQSDAASSAVTSQDAEPAPRAVMDGAGDDTPELTPIREEHDHRDRSEVLVQGQPEEEGVAVVAGLASIDEHAGEGHPADILEVTSSGSVGAVSERCDDSERVEQQLERRASQRQRQGRGDRQQSGSASVQRVRHVHHHDERMTRKKSVYHAYQNLQLAEEARLRELRLRDDALLERVREMLEQTSSQTCQHQDGHQLRSLVQDLVADNEHIRSETSELTRELTEQCDLQRQSMEEALSLHNQQLDELHRRLEHELESVRHQHEEQLKLQEESAERDASRRVQLIEQQLQDAITQLVAMLEGHAQEVTAKMTALGARLQGQFVTKTELDERQAQWQRTAVSNCVFGATPETLAEVQSDLDAFRSVKASPTTDSDGDADALDAALDQLAQTLEDALEIARNGSGRESSDESGGEIGHSAQYLPLSPDDLRVMKSIRVQLGKVNDLIGRRQQASATDNGQDRDPTDEADSGPGLGLLATALQRMELGTASLLDGCDAQFTRYQEASRSHQVAIGQLQQQLRQQTQSEMALRARLALCPSQEDTQSLLQALQDKIAEMTSDSASQTAATLAELRAKLTDLPSHELLQRLALDLHGKADRTEMDRLRSLLEAQNATGLPGPAASLTKSPLRCLSCDQTLFSMPTSPTSQPGSPNSPSRPLVQLPACQNCGHGSSPTHAGRGGRLLESQETDIDGNAERMARVWSTPAFATSTAVPTAAAGAESDSSDITDDLFAIAAAARQRRQREQQQLPMRSSAMTQVQAKRAATAGARRAFVNLDDARNRIPLRRPVLADHIVYGPSIALHALRKKLAILTDPNNDRGPRVAIATTERRAPGGQVIARASVTTALVRPFAELERGDDRLARQSQAPSQQQQSQRQQRSDRGNR